MTSTTARPRRRKLYTCMVAVAAAMLLAPVSTPGIEGGQLQASAYSVQDASHRVADEPETPTRAEGIAAEAAAARIADEAQTLAADKRAAAEEASRVQAQQEAAARVKVEQEAAARVKAEAEAEAAAAAVPAGRVINVGHAGGQDVVNMGIGPVLFPMPGWPPYVAEHDYHGGWDRIGTLAPGMAVTMTGLVSGSYTVGEIITVPRGGHTSDLIFSVMPKVLLQTCIPGTSQMVVVGLY